MKLIDEYERLELLARLKEKPDLETIKLILTKLEVTFGQEEPELKEEVLLQVAERILPVLCMSKADTLRRVLRQLYTINLRRENAKSHKG